MDTPPSEEELKRIFSRVFEVEASEILDSSRRGELKGWDSLGQLELIGALEEELKIEIDEDDALDIETYEDVRRMLSRLMSNA